MTSLFSRRQIILVAIFAATLATVVSAQGQVVTDTQSRADDVVRVNTELVQTDVMVFDKKGRFVDQLTADQFQLLVDNKLQPITFFERVTSGLMASNGNPAQPAGT